MSKNLQSAVSCYNVSLMTNRKTYLKNIAEAVLPQSVFECHRRNQQIGCQDISNNVNFQALHNVARLMLFGISQVFFFLCIVGIIKSSTRKEKTEHCSEWRTGKNRPIVRPEQNWSFWLCQKIVAIPPSIPSHILMIIKGESADNEGAIRRGWQLLSTIITSVDEWLRWLNM